MTWILFLYLSTVSPDGISVTTAEFDGQAACQYAADLVTAGFETPMTVKPKTICVPKGNR